MNKKGQSIFLLITTAIMVFIAGILFITFIDLEKDAMMDNLLCGPADSPNLTMSDGSKMTCLIGEVVSPYFIIIIIGAAGAIVLARIIL